MSGDWLEHTQANPAPEYTVFETKIDDEKGERNIALLSRTGGLWFVPDGSMYVYYTPTHYRTPRAGDIAQIVEDVDGQIEQIQRTKQRIAKTETRP